jgi:imidazolonepropionase-like amidohydrolase
VRAARVLDARGGPPLEDGVVEIGDGQIVRVLPASTREPSAEVEQDHFPDGTLLPGLIDAHTHLSLAADGRSYEAMSLDPDALMALTCIRNLRLHLAAGVTTLRDNGARNRITFLVREALNRGYFVGPRLLLCGRAISHTAGHFYLYNEIADSAEEMRRAVRKLIAEGADHIKIMASGGKTAGNQAYFASYTADELRVAVEAAHDLGRLTTAHCRARDSMQRALEAGLDCIEHAEFLVPPHDLGLGTGVVPAGVISYDPHLTERLLARGVFLSFTYQVGGYDTLVDLRRERTVRSLLSGEQAELDRLERHFEAKHALFGRLLADGALPHLVVSSDAGPFDCQFGRMWYGLELAVKGGMTPQQAIESVTRFAAEAVGLSASIGTLEPGRCADMVVVRGNPLEDIRRMADVLAVYRVGVRVI